MPTRRCCCGSDVCFTYPDAFQRAGNDETLLEPDWEVCGDWTDWEINPVSPAFIGIVTRANDSKMILKKMVGHPYGIFHAKIEADTVGQIFRIYIYHGTVDDACTVPSNSYAEIEVTDTNEIKQSLVINGVPEFEDTYDASATLPEIEWRICVKDNLIESVVSGGLAHQHCVAPSGYYFGIGAGDGTVTKWAEIRYEDHFLHNPSCLNCIRGCCFPTVDRTIGAFDVTISGIESNNCECQSTISTVRLYLATGVGLSGICSCSPRFEATITGPHGVGCSPNTSTLRVSFDCDENTGEKGVSLQIIPDDGGLNEWDWSKAFGSSALPEDIRIDNDHTVDVTGDNQSCDYTNVTITVIPVVVQGCCDEVPVLSPLLGNPNLQSTLAPKIQELPHSEHLQVIEELRKLRTEVDSGLGDTAKRLIAESTKNTDFIWLLRCFLKFYSCRRREAVDMVNRHFPN